LQDRLPGARRQRLVGRTVLPIDDTLRFIASEDIFWAAR
jgi:hypothetical protein